MPVVIGHGERGNLKRYKWVDLLEPPDTVLDEKLIVAYTLRPNQDRYRNVVTDTLRCKAPERQDAVVNLQFRAQRFLLL